jgi:hypothetical protein
MTDHILSNSHLHFRDISRWLLSVYNEIDQSNIELKLLLPLTALCLSSDSLSQSHHYQSIQIASSRILYYCISPLLNSFSKDNICAQLRQIKFPQAYALFLKDLSRLIKPTTSLNLSIDLIWELMPDIDEHQRLINEYQKCPLQQQQNVQIINDIIPEIWGEIGKKLLSMNISSACQIELEKKTSGKYKNKIFSIMSNFNNLYLA